MATRVIENRRDRLATILVAPLMSCSARLPVYMLLIGAFLTRRRSRLSVVGAGRWRCSRMYMHRPGRRAAGGLAAEADAAARRDAGVRDGDAAVQGAVAADGAAAHDRQRLGVRRRAGTMILASMVVVWALLYFPHGDAAGQSYDAHRWPRRKRAWHRDSGAWTSSTKARRGGCSSRRRSTRTRRSDRRLAASGSGRAASAGWGSAIEPAVRPLGWDWKIGMAALASFPGPRGHGRHAGHHLRARARSTPRTIREAERRRDTRWHADPGRDLGDDPARHGVHACRWRCR